jgi:hypothetical protein
MRRMGELHLEFKRVGPVLLENVMWILNKIIVLFGFLILGGCAAALKGYPEQPRRTTIAEQDPAYLVEPDTLKAYREEKDSLTKKLLRNEIIDERVLEIDQRFEEYERDLWKQGIGSGVGTDWVQLALAGATATVGGAGVKAALGAVSAGIIGAKASFDKHALMEKTIPIIMSSMVAERETIRAAIAKNKQLPVADYTLFTALSELRKFIQAGTIPGALQNIAIDTGQKATKASQDIKNVQTIHFIKDEAGSAILAYWMPDGKTINKDNEKKLKEWMDSNGLTTRPSDITRFWSDADRAALRVRAVKELINK